MNGCVRLGQGHKPFTFPRADGSFRISSLGFWNDSGIGNTIIEWKLRAAYGQAGIQPKPFDRFPTLKIMAAHGGGYLPSYVDRLDHGCITFPQMCKVPLKKKPSEYFHQIYVDSLIFSPEALRHLIAETGSGQIMIGTDYPFPWTSTAVDHVLATSSLSEADRVAILGGTARALLGIPA